MRWQCTRVFVFLLCLAESVHAYQEWNINHFSIAEGLSYEVVRDIAMSRGDSTVWIATWGGGISGFRDGKWTYLRKEDGLPGDSFRAVFPVANNGLWIGGIDGIAFYDSRGLQIFTKENTPGLPDHNIFIINEVPDGNLWFGTADGYILATSATYRIPAKRVWRVVMDQSLSQGKSVRQIFTDNTGQTWAATSQTGLFRHNGKGWIREVAPEMIRNRSLRSACQSSDGSLWIGGTPNIARKNGTEWTVLADYNNFANWICPTPENGVWVGDQDGVSVYRNGEWSRVVLESQEQEQFVEIIRSLPDGSIWVGTRNGVYRVVPTCWRVHTTTAEGKNLSPNVLLAEPDHPPLAVDDANQFVIYENNQWIPKGTLPESPDYRGLLTQVRSGKFWIAGASNVYCVTRESLQIGASIPMPEDSLVREINLSPDGVLWALTREGIYRHSGAGWIPEPPDPGYKRNPAYCMEYADDGSQWFGLQDRVEHWKDGKVVEYHMGEPPYPDLSTPLRSIKLLSDHTLWFASTSEGVAIFDGKNWDTLGIGEGLSSQQASCVYEARDGTLLVGYRTTGISQRHNHGYWSSFGSKDGIPPGQISYIGESPKGRYWSRVHAAGIVSLEPKGVPPRTILKSFQAQLNPGEKAEISFAGFDIDNRTGPNEMVYSWRFVPNAEASQDAGWSPFRRISQVETPELSPGDYLFQVRAGDIEGDIDPDPASVSLRVLPPVWQTAEVLIPGIVLLVLGVLLSWLLVRKQRALQQSEKRFRSLVEGVPTIPIQGFDTERRIIFWNTASELLYGYQRKEIIGKKIDVLFSAPEVRDSINRQLADAFNNGIPPPSGELSVLSNKGELVPVYSCFVIIRNPQGDPEIFCFDVDLTDRKRAEEERKFLDSLVQYSQKLEGLGVLAGGIAHDFNNLLLGIMGNAELALHEIPKTNPVCAYLNSICKAADRAADLTRQMLAFSGKGKFLVVNLDLNKSVQSTVQLMSPAQLEKISVRYELAESLPLIQADSSQIQQLIMNMFQNAIESIDHTQSGDVVIRTGMRDYSSRDLSSSRLPDFPAPGPFVFLEIEDNGCGMDQEVSQKLFEPFFTTKFLGRGLGLAAVLGIVRGHNGAIFVNSEVGKGAVLRVVFPCGREQPQVAENVKPGTASIPRHEKPRILVVDDDDAVREVACRMLEKMLYDVQMVTDGIEAVEMVRSQPDGFDCVLLDLSMPRMNGIQAMELIHQINPNLPVILSSGFSESEIRQKWSGSEGISGFIQKPYLSTVLREKLQAILVISEPA